VIVKIEVLGYNDLPEKLIILEEFLSLSNVYQLTDAVTEKTIQLRRSYRGLKLGDALIAATALVNNFVLITRNTKDFHQIIGLKVINPYDL
jgi:predicted nucleic acid-binding protein